MKHRPKIDYSDVRILKILLTDPRTSFAKIANDLEMSTGTVRNRFIRLKEIGVITGEIMQINPIFFGYTCIGTMLIQTDGNDAKVMEFLKNFNRVIAITQTIGKYNILSVTAQKSVNDLAKLIEHLMGLPKVINVDECLWIDLIRLDHPENLLIESFDGSSQTTELLPNIEKNKPNIANLNVDFNLTNKNSFKTKNELNEIDVQIIKILSGNARASFSKVAKQLGISTQTVMRKYSKLRKNAIPYSSVAVDLSKLGYVGNALFLIKVAPEHQTSEVFDKITRISNVIVANKCIGTYDLIIAIPITTLDQLFEKKQEICKIQGIKQIDLLFDRGFSSWPLNIFASVLPN